MFYNSTMKKVNTSSISLGIILVVGVSLTQFGYSVSIVGLTITGVTSVLTYFCIQTKKTVLSSWLHLLRQICDICIASHGLSILLDYMNGKQPHSYIHLIPTSTMPHVMPIMVLIVITFLFVLGLEASTILEALLKAFLISALVMFALSAATLVRYPDNKMLQIPDDPAQKVLLASAFFWSCYPDNTKSIDLTSIVEHLMKHGLFSAAIIIILFIPTAECVMVGLICPISHWYPWYEPTMVCLALSCLCLTLPQIFSAALQSLVIPSQFKLNWFFKENPKIGTQVRAIISIGFISVIMVYFHSMYNLILISSSCTLLSHAFDTTLAMHDQYQPLLAPRDTVYYIKLALFGEKVNVKRKKSKYISLNRKTNVGNSNLEDDKFHLMGSLSDDSGHSSDTDIDSVVAEYKNSVKVKAFNFRRKNKEPSLRTGRIVGVLLSFIVLQAILCSFAVLNSMYTIAVSTLLANLLTTVIIYGQPQKTETKRLDALSLVKNVAVISFEIVLLSTIIVKTVVSLLIWIIGGIICTSILNKFRTARKGKRQRINLQSPPGPFTVGKVLPVQRNVPYESVHA